MPRLLPPLWFGLASASADMTKVFLDHHGWERLMNGRAGTYLRNLTPGKSLIAKAALLFTGAILKWRLNKEAPVAMYLQEIVGDAPSEIIGRMDKKANAQPHRPSELQPRIAAGLISFGDRLNAWSNKR